MPRQSKLDPSIIRVGDTVEITNPVVVVRVGYPKTTSDYMAEASAKLEPVLHEWLKLKPRAPLKSPVLPASAEYKHFDTRFVKVLREAAYLALKRDGFGGRERTLHIETFPALAGKHGRVMRMKTVHTGRYYPASGSMSLYEDDYEPGGLAEEQRHRLVELDVQIAEFRHMSALGRWFRSADVKKIASASEYQHRLRKAA